MVAPPPVEPRGASSATRLRRLRRSAGMRDWLAESRFDSGRTIYPIFVRPGTGPRERLASLPGIFRYSPEEGARHAGEAFEAGVPAVLLFGQSQRKDPRGKEAYNPDGPVARTIRTIKRLWPSLVVISDVCICGYTDHGHCGVRSKGHVDNDATLAILEKVAVLHARAGAEIFATSAMKDHQVAHISGALDRAGFSDTGILACSAKFGAAANGPFRDDADPSVAVADRLEYQLDPRNTREALREIEHDIAEGADLVLVKPALPALDIIARARDRFHIPIVAYQVGGEYAMIQAAAERGWIEARAGATESLTAIHRAGADLVVTYFALSLARWEQERVD
ncbi:MAG: porphobilinogen synthase [Thermoplasmata archaeon]|nr:porphobilinogen synthase [Thermoplasmata archaeon]